MTKIADLSPNISELWADTADYAVKGINKITTYSSDRLNNLTEQAKISLEGSLSQADNFGSYLAGNMETAFNSLLTDWFSQHPFILWLCQHPIVTLVIAFVLGVILWRLLAAIASLVTTAIDRIWLWMFRSPVLLIKSLFNVRDKTPKEKELLEITINPAQFEQIINQLSQIQAQQTLIIQEINILKQSHKISESNLLFIDKTHQSIVNDK